MANPPSDARLTSLLTALLAEEHLPLVDRWFSAHAKRNGWPVTDQKRLWNSLRRVLTGTYALTGTVSEWTAVRGALRGRAPEWARLERSGPPATAREAGIPGWLEGEFRERAPSWSADELQLFLAAQASAPPVHLRFRGEAKGAEARQRMAALGQLDESGVPGIVRLTTDHRLEDREEWKQGLVDIQDAASQLSLEGLELRPGMRVWDVCAGQGGKTLLAAGELRGKGAVAATDVSAPKLKALKERIRRWGWQNIRVVEWDGEVLPAFGPELSSGFDRVIVDAPCSASGTWRRDPEARFRLTPEALAELHRHQERLIRLGWSVLKPGGRLAYVTCSWLPSENEHLVSAFAAESGARLVGQRLLGLPAFDANTMFSAVLEKA